MISPIGSGYSSPVYIQPPDLSDLQNSSTSSPAPTKIRKGIAEYQDSFEPAKALQAEESKKRYEFQLEIDRKSWELRRNHNLRMVHETQKEEQTKAFRPQPVEAPVVIDPSLNAALTANLLSMIRV